MKTCPTCGKEISDGRRRYCYAECWPAAVCPGCGIVKRQRAKQRYAHNHRAWIAILIALLMHETAYGRLGETLEQSIARYGKEIYLGEENAGLTPYGFRPGDYVVVIWLLRGTTQQIEYFKWSSSDQGEMSQAEKENLLEIEGGGFMELTGQQWLRGDAAHDYVMANYFFAPRYGPDNKGRHVMQFYTSEAFNAHRAESLKSQKGL
jgi:hypothetical protein